MRPSSPTWRLPAAVALVLLVGACSGAEEPDGAPPQAEENEESNTESTATETNAELGDVVELEDLRFRLPGDMTEIEDNATPSVLAFADTEWVRLSEEDPDAAREVDSPGLRVFLEDAAPAVGATTMIEAHLAAADENYESEVSEVEIEGADGGVVMRSSHVPPDKDGAVVQWDIVVEMAESPQFHIRYGADEGVFDTEAAQAMLDSIQVDRY